MSCDEAKSKYNEYMTNRALDYECASLINKAICERKTRIKKWALRQLGKHRNIYFVTIGFNEKINARSIENKKAFVKRYLNKLECNYVYGIGVGKENGRIHFHALTTRKPKEKDKTDFGYIRYQRVARRVRLEKDNFCSLLLDYIDDKNFKLDIKTRNKILRTSGNLLLQKIAYIVKNTFHASLVLDKT